jgi:hypothetical protein
MLIAKSLAATYLASFFPPASASHTQNSFCAILRVCEKKELPMGGIGIQRKNQAKAKKDPKEGSQTIGPESGKKGAKKGDIPGRRLQKEDQQKGTAPKAKKGTAPPEGDNRSRKRRRRRWERVMRRGKLLLISLFAFPSLCLLGQKKMEET